MSFEKDKRPSQHPDRAMDHLEVATVRLLLAKTHLQTAQEEIKEALQLHLTWGAGSSEVEPLQVLYEQTASLLVELHKICEKT